MLQQKKTFLRYLPHINSTDGGHARAAAERQAINSTVQGSAADLVKKAMIDIERKLADAFPESRKPVRNRKSDTASRFCQVTTSKTFFRRNFRHQRRISLIF
jgi:type IV secretory pathway TrbL component